MTLIVLFSAGSLVALSGDALTDVGRQWQSEHQLAVPAAISVAVSTLLVTCMDVGILYAASMLRLLATRRADPGEMRLHRFVLLTVAALEAGTYSYMAWEYDRPASLVAWALILARASAAPLMGVYLSLARPLPVQARDILAQVELAAGAGVIRDVTIAASDAGASLADKMVVFSAAALMSAQDRQRLTELIGTVEASAMRAPPLLPPGPPDGLPPRRSKREGSNPASPRGVRRRKVLQLASGNAEQRIRTVLAADPRISVKRLARQTRVSVSTASKWQGVIAAEASRGDAGDELQEQEEMAQ